MKAIVIDQFGGPEVLVERDIPLPLPSRDQVRVKIKAIGFNPYDCKMRSGVYGGALPQISGADFSGVIDAVGNPGHEFSVGDRVFGITMGTYAESICVSTQLIAKIPKNLSFEEAAVIPVVYLTAFQAMIGKGILQQDRPFFIAGGSGGVGNAAIALAKAYKAGPIFTMSGNPQSRAYLTDELHIPGHQILDYKGLSGEEMARKLIEMNGNQRFYFALDLVGGKTKELCFALVDYYGHVASILPEEKEISIGCESIIWNKSLSLHMILSFAAFIGDPQKLIVYKSQLNHLAKLFENRDLSPPQFKNIGPLSAKTAQEAHRLLEGHSLGKMVMSVSDSN